MLKRIAIAAVSVLCMAAAWFLWLDRQFWDSAPPQPESPEAPANATQSMSSVLDDTSGLSLSLKSILLSQGEGGIEVWRLKAQWASAQKDGDTILAARPRLVYKMPPDNRELLVTADKGDIRQKEQILRFIGSVFATQGNSTVRGPLLVYNGTAKTMAFPDGGEFDGEGVAGSAPRIVWNMKNGTIEASGGIAVDFTQSPSLSDLQGKKPVSGELRDTAPSPVP